MAAPLSVTENSGPRVPALSESLYRGVSKTSNGNFRAECKRCKPRKHLGTYPTARDAGRAYAHHVHDVHGERDAYDGPVEFDEHVAVARVDLEDTARVLGRRHARGCPGLSAKARGSAAVTTM